MRDNWSSHEEGGLEEVKTSWVAVAVVPGQGAELRALAPVPKHEELRCGHTENTWHQAGLGPLGKAMRGALETGGQAWWAPNEVCAEGSTEWCSPRPPHGNTGPHQTHVTPLGSPFNLTGTQGWPVRMKLKPPLPSLPFGTHAGLSVYSEPAPPSPPS